MKLFLCFLALVIMDNGVLGAGVRIRWGKGSLDNVDTEYFFSVPTSVPEALDQGWSKTARPEGHLPELDMYCEPSDVTVCALFDSTEYFAGLQVALEETGFAPGVLNHTIQGYSYWTTQVGNETRNYWTTRVYTVSSETLQESEEDRVASRNSSIILQEESIWLTGYYGDLYEVPLDIDTSDFTVNNCYSRMGDHYFYHLTPESECVSEDLFTWFVLAKSGRVHGLVFWTLGTPNATVETVHPWFEYPSLTVVRTLASNAPECAFTLAGELGVSFMHIYFIDEPWLITCD